MAELLNCPWCGSEPQRDAGWGGHLSCPNLQCPIGGELHDEHTLWFAEDAWNRRTPPPQAAGGEPVACRIGHSEFIPGCSYCAANLPEKRLSDSGWRCTECNSTSFCVVDERGSDGAWRPGTTFRCINCKKDHPQPRVSLLADHPPAVGQELADYQRIARLIGEIFYYGNFKAETFNERELEKLLRKTGHLYETEEQVLAATAQPTGANQ
jgi:hypothetical protein